jgi:hypothetical protein
MAIWHVVPVLAALIIAGWNPWVLLFAPVASHAWGGQTAVFAMLGLWGYRRNTDPRNGRGGLWLALTLLKPQLGLVPTAWAAVQWWKSGREARRIPRQTWAWFAALAAIYLPGLALIPDWPARWLNQPRPVLSRALSGFVPRTLLFWTSPAEAGYWIALITLGGLILFGVWRIGRRLTLDLAMLWSFTVSPLVHDYDLSQLVPVLDAPVLQRAAILLSLPGWLVILFAYGNDAAWYAFTIIAPGLLAMRLYLRHRSRERGR